MKKITHLLALALLILPFSLSVSFADDMPPISDDSYVDSATPKETCIKVAKKLGIKIEKTHSGIESDEDGNQFIRATYKAPGDDYMTIGRRLEVKYYDGSCSIIIDDERLEGEHEETASERNTRHNQELDDNPGEHGFVD